MNNTASFLAYSAESQLINITAVIAHQATPRSCFVMYDDYQQFL